MTNPIVGAPHAVFSPSNCMDTAEENPCKSSGLNVDSRAFSRPGVRSDLDPSAYDPPKLVSPLVVAASSLNRER
jgi:hypothetical protein